MLAEILIIFTIIALYLSVIFLVRSRIMMIIFIMLANLITILFYSLIVSEAQNLKELIIATIIFSTTILALIANSDSIYVIFNIPSKNPKFILTAIFCAVTAVAISIGVFYLAKNINNISAIVREKQNARQSEIAENPLIFPGHPVHINVKKYYLGTDYKSEIFNISPSKNINELYDEQYKQKLRDSVLFKRLTDAIIIIAGIMTILLLSKNYKIIPKSNESL